VSAIELVCKARLAQRMLLTSLIMFFRVSVEILNFLCISLIFVSKHLYKSKLFSPANFKSLSIVTSPILRNGLLIILSNDISLPSWITLR